MNREKNWTGKKAAGGGLKVIDGGATLIGRELPHSLDAEEYLLACCFIDGPDTVARCQAEKLGPGAFFAPANQIIFAKIIDLHERGLPVEVAVMAEELAKTGQLEVVGGVPYLAQVTTRIPTTAQVAYFVSRVKELWILRELVTESARAIDACFEYDGSGVEALLLPLATRFNRAIDFARNGTETMESRAESGYQRILLKLDGKQDTSRQLFTRMPEFDKRFGAFDVLEEEWLIGVAALPSVGKSALVRKWVDRFLLDGKRGIAFPLETGVGKWMELSAATACRINARALNDLPPDMAKTYREALEIRRNWIGERLWVYDDPIKAETLCARVEDHVRQHGRVDFVVVDHLHELYSSSPNKFRGQREQELGFIAKELKKTAKRLNIPFFVPTQLNRAPTKDGVYRRPTMQDIRGSGEIEAAYDRLLILHVPKEDMRGAEQTENQSRIMMELIQAKSRNGPKGLREFWFDRPFTDFVEIRDHEFERKPNTPGGAANPGGYKR